jgi:type VI secretion system protein ImpK
MDSDDPFSENGNSDRTVIRPTPGRRTAGGSSPAQPQPGLPTQAPPVQYSPQAYPDSVQPPPAGPQFSSPAATAVIASGLNPLVDSAAALLVLAGQLRNTAAHPDVAGLREHVAQQIKVFEDAARSRGVTPETNLAARYVLCTFLDETVLSTPWGSESIWSSQSLLSSFHNERWGGEKFYMILERMIQNPAANIDMLELMYVCLALGFEGKYGVLEQGRSRLAETQDNLFRTIRLQRGDFERQLSPNWRGVQDRNKLVRYVPLWVVGALAGVLLLVTYAGFRFILEDTSGPIYDELDAIGRVSVIEKE